MHSCTIIFVTTKNSTGGIMKKALIAFTVLMSTSSFAAYGPAGCGFGTMLLGEQKGLPMNVIAATINGSSGNQTFGMSTGTLGCKVDDSTKVAALNFIEGNKVALAKDAALGKGETLAALAKIYKCSNVESFGETLQGNYEEIFMNNSSEKIDETITEAVISEKSCV